VLYVHTDIYKKLKYFILGYLKKASSPPLNFSTLNPLYHTFIYNLLPEDGTWGLKRLEGIKIKILI